MKRIAAVIFALVLSVITLSVTASAGRTGCDLASNWSGGVSEIQDMRGVHYLVLKEPGTAYYDFDISPGEKYFYLIVWAGNYQGRGKCSFTLDCLGESGKLVSTLGSVDIPDDGNFYRTELGYIPDGITAEIPEGTAVMRLSINFEGGKNSPYFQVSASFSDRAVSVTPKAVWTAPEKSKQVDVETTAMSFWLSIGFVCAVAVIMMIVALIRKKYTKGKIK